MVWLPPFHLARSEIDPSRSSNDKEWHVSIRWPSKPKKGVVCFVKMWVAPPFFRSRFVLVPKRDITRLPTKTTRPLGTHFFRCAFSRCLQEQSLPVFSGNDCRRWGLLFFHVFSNISHARIFFNVFVHTVTPRETGLVGNFVYILHLQHFSTTRSHIYIYINWFQDVSSQ